MVVDSYDTVLISGLGPVGLGGVVNAVTRGARAIGLESNPYRANLARAIGADEVIDPNNPDAIERIMELTNGLGADKSIEASSQEPAPSFLLSATRRGGQMSSVGWGGPVRMADVVARGVTVRGNWHWNHLQDMDRMFDTIRRASPLLDKMITHRFPMSRVQDAWETQIHGQCGKVTLDPSN
jgi:threonine dehydrogenase-like Zn-dependent dehydrogenase